MSTQGGQKTGKDHVFGSEQGLKSKGSDPQAGMHYEMILPISEQQIKHLNRLAFSHRSEIFQT